jgi:DNA-binding NtrC family response regulator
MGDAGPKVKFPDPKNRTPILVVDDEVLIRMALADFLQDWGFKVLGAGSAREAIEILQSEHPTIDLVFSDVNMPGAMNGFGRAKWIRENCNNLPVMLTSGDVKKSEAAHELCADEPFFEKPYDLHAVVRQIRHTLNERLRR